MINATGNRMTREITRQAKLAQDVAQTQIQLSTGKRLQRASDDPVASARVATLRTAQANNVAWDANIRLGQSLTAQADTVLASASDLLVRAKELSLSAANGTLTDAAIGHFHLEKSRPFNSHVQRIARSGQRTLQVYTRRAGHLNPGAKVEADGIEILLRRWRAGRQHGLIGKRFEIRPVAFEAGCVHILDYPGRRVGAIERHACRFHTGRRPYSQPDGGTRRARTALCQ